MMPEELSKTTLSEMIEANQVGFLADLGRVPGVEFHETPEMAWFTTGLPNPRLNRVIKTRLTAADPGETLAAMMGVFRAQKLPFLWHLGPSTRPPDLGQRLGTYGLRCLGEEVGMAADLEQVDHAAPLPARLTIERVGNLETLREWSRLFTTIYEIPEDMAEVFFRLEASLLAQVSHRHLFVGYWDRQPAAVATLFLGAAAAGIFGVGALPTVRRQGIGTAITRTLLTQAYTMGYRIATLNASAMGAGIYRSLGFQDYCTLSRYAG